MLLRRTARSCLASARHRSTISTTSLLLSALIHFPDCLPFPWRHIPSLKALVRELHTGPASWDDSNSGVWAPVQRFLELRKAGRPELGILARGTGAARRSFLIMTVAGPRTASMDRGESHSFAMLRTVLFTIRDDNTIRTPRPTSAHGQAFLARAVYACARSPVNTHIHAATHHRRGVLPFPGARGHVLCFEDRATPVSDFLIEGRCSVLPCSRKTRS